MTPANAANPAPNVRPKVAVVRGKNLNAWELQNYEPLVSSYDITAYVTTEARYEFAGSRIPVKRLPPHPEQSAFMVGLEDELRDKDIVYTADITWLFTMQAVNARQMFRNRVVALEWENIPFAYEDHPEMPGMREMKRINCRFIDRFVAVTERARDALLLEGVPAERISVIPMGINLERFRPSDGMRAAGRREMGAKDGETVVLFIGRLVWEKGIFDLVHAAKILFADPGAGAAAARFVVVGKGHEERRMRERVRDLGLEGRFSFVESVPYARVPEWLNAADMLVLPSISTRYWKEQFGMVLAEAMACGTAVVSTKSGSIPEVVGDAGIFAREEDPRDLAGAIGRLSEDPAARAKLGGLGRERAQSLFDSRETARKVDELFRRILAEGKGGESPPSGRAGGSGERRG